MPFDHHPKNHQTHSDHLMGEMKEFKGELKEFKRVAIERLKSIEEKQDAFSKFQWKLLGASGLAAFLATIAVELVRMK